MIVISNVEKTQYGIEKFGRLKAALLHRPDQSLAKITEDNREFFLFDKVPDVNDYLMEHQRYCDLLESHGVTVYQLSDYVNNKRGYIIMLIGGSLVYFTLYLSLIEIVKKIEQITLIYGFRRRFFITISGKNRY
jgi:hypothetical protein